MFPFPGTLFSRLLSTLRITACRHRHLLEGFPYPSGWCQSSCHSLLSPWAHRSATPRGLPSFQLLVPAKCLSEPVELGAHGWNKQKIITTGGGVEEYRAPSLTQRARPLGILPDAILQLPPLLRLILPTSAPQPWSSVPRHVLSLLWALAHRVPCAGIPFPLFSTGEKPFLLLILQGPAQMSPPPGSCPGFSGEVSHFLFVFQLLSSPL